jgi:hypothetical protein
MCARPCGAAGHPEGRVEVPKPAAKAATQAGARKVDPAHHEAIMAEAVCWDRLEYDSESDSEADEESSSESDAAKDGSDAED